MWVIFEKNENTFSNVFVIVAYSVKKIRTFFIHYGNILFKNEYFS